MRWTGIAERDIRTLYGSFEFDQNADPLSAQVVARALAQAEARLPDVANLGVVVRVQVDAFCDVPTVVGSCDLQASTRDDAQAEAELALKGSFPSFPVTITVREVY